MKASYHVAVSAGVSLGFQAIFQSWPATLGCFLSGVLIDLDHYLEYYIFKKSFPYKYKHLLRFCYYGKDSKIYLIFHGYEYLMILWIVISFFHLSLLPIGIAVGLTVHIFFDQFTNPVKPLFYFLTFRIYHHFEKTKILTKEYFELNSMGKDI